MGIAHVWRILSDIYDNGNETVGCVIRLTMSYQDYASHPSRPRPDQSMHIPYCYEYVFQKSRRAGMLHDQASPKHHQNWNTVGVCIVEEHVNHSYA